MSLPIALQLYSIRDRFPNDPIGTLKAVKAMGYDGVETGLYGFEPEQICAWCAEAGLTIVSTHVPLGEMLKDPIGTLTHFSKLGCRYTVVPYLAPNIRAVTPNYPYIVEFIRQLCMAAKSLGLTMLYHNHDFDFAKFNGQYALDYLYAQIPATLLQTELDTCWIHVAGVDPSQYIRKYAGRTPVIHLKDYSAQRPTDGKDPFAMGLTPQKAMIDFQYRPLGDGVLDMPSVLRASVYSGAEWVIVEQDSPTVGSSSIECAAKSIQYLRSVVW